MAIIEAVLFDLDGTLLDRDKSLIAFVSHQYERLAPKLSSIPKEDYISRFIELDNNGYVWKDKVYKQLINEFNLTDCTEKELLDDYVSNFKHYCIPFQHLHRMLNELQQQNIKLGMITNGYGQFQLDNIQALGIEQKFEVILISEWEGMKKPNPEIFARALTKLKVNVASSMFVGDHAMNDIEAAKNVGMIAVWKRNNASQTEKADYNIDELSEIPLLVQQMVLREV
ncbi:HAD family hydrolase [Lysinibacillus sp. FSL W8-0992]|uniref:HAD family hydrolase n=1 Tax=Lysinibacillus sp. FSL W8-0992 TaxID=2954643 RepID=UPI0030FC135D